MGFAERLQVFANARKHNQSDLAAIDLKGWISWARRSRLESFKRLGATLKKHFDAVVRGMLDNCKRRSRSAPG